MSAADDPAASSADLLARVDRLLAERDPDAAVVAAVRAVDEGVLGVAELYDAVLVPLLVRIGSRWQTGRTHVWEEHLASAAIRGIVESVRPRVASARAAVTAAHEGEEPSRALFACPPDEWHVLGLRMLADRFAMRGWRTFYLGADVPVAEIVAAARDLGVDLVVLMAATHYERLELRELLGGIKARLPGVRLLVGGPAFSAEHEDWSEDELVDPRAIPDAYA
jgi:methanogenic corrinoid protein MtbC1